MEVVSSIAKRALSLIADAGHLSLPEPPLQTPMANEQRRGAPPAAQLFEQELQRIGCSTASDGSARDSGSGAATHAGGVGGSGTRQHTSGTAGFSGRGSCGGSREDNTASAAQAGGDGAGSSATGLGPSPRVAALLARLQAFIAEHLAPADAALHAFHGDRSNPDRCVRNAPSLLTEIAWRESHERGVS